MTMRTWGFAAGLAAALAFVGQARAQSGSSNQMGGTAEQGTPSARHDRHPEPGRALGLERQRGEPHGLVGDHPGLHRRLDRLRDPVGAGR